MYLRKLGLVAVSTMALIAITGVGAVHATTLVVQASPQNKAVTLEGSQLNGPITLKDTNNTFIDSCTSSTFKGSTVSPFTAATVTAPLSSLTLSGCTHKTSVIKPGTLHLEFVPGLFSPRYVYSSGAEVTVESTIFGASCIAKTGTGTKLGTFTDGASNTHATITLWGTIPMGLCGDAVLGGQYIVTSPLGLSLRT